MRWSQPAVIELESKHVPSMLSQNLEHDSQGRFAFISGRTIVYTRRDPKFSQSLDMELSMKFAHDRIDITRICYWPNSGGGSYQRPLLVVATDAHYENPARLEVYDTSSGSGNLVASYIFGQDTSGSKANPKGEAAAPQRFTHDQLMKITQVSYVNCISYCRVVHGKPGNVDDASSFAHEATTMNELVVGTDNGLIMGFLMASNRLIVRFLIDDAFTGVVSSVSGDLSYLGPSVAAMDETGKTVLWRKYDSEWKVRYVTQAHLDIYDQEDEDHSGLVLHYDDLLIVGRRTGIVEIHKVSKGYLYARYNVCTMPITGLDIHRKLGILLVGGEDGRITLLILPDSPHAINFAKIDAKAMIESSKLMLGTFGLNGIVTGLRFLKPNSDCLDFIFMSAERPYFIKYEYQRL